MICECSFMEISVVAKGQTISPDRIGMKETQSAIYDMNRDLISEHVKRVANHELLVRSLKEVNAVVQVAASLRGKKGGWKSGLVGEI